MVYRAVQVGESTTLAVGIDVNASYDMQMTLIGFTLGKTVWT